MVVPYGCLPVLKYCLFCFRYFSTLLYRFAIGSALINRALSKRKYDLFLLHFIKWRMYVVLAFEIYFENET
jgi:hypothetical protein